MIPKSTQFDFQLGTLWLPQLIETKGQGRQAGPQSDCERKRVLPKKRKVFLTGTRMAEGSAISPYWYWGLKLIAPELMI